MTHSACSLIVLILKSNFSIITIKQIQFRASILASMRARIILSTTQIEHGFVSVQLIQLGTLLVPVLKLLIEVI